MAIITRWQIINAQIEDVFAAIVDGGDFASWNPTIRASRAVDDRPPGDGKRLEWDLRGFGNVVQELREYERPTQVRIVPLMKQMEGGHRFRLTAQSEGTRVDLEHRDLERMGDGAPAMREAIDAPGGWSGLLELYSQAAGQ